MPSHTVAEKEKNRRAKIKKDVIARLRKKKEPAKKKPAAKKKKRSTLGDMKSLRKI